MMRTTQSYGRNGVGLRISAFGEKTVQSPRQFSRSGISPAHDWEWVDFCRPTVLSPLRIASPSTLQMSLPFLMREG